jgi:serine/threonine protein kinase
MRKLGKGTFGLVVLARENQTQKQVAVKICLGMSRIDEEYTKQEMRVLKVIGDMESKDSFV